MKILVAIANYGTKNMGFLRTLIKEYQSMPYLIDIVVFSNIPKELGSGVEVKVGLPYKNPWSLPFAHKTLFAENASDYDLFIYSEDDTLITENNIKAFLEVTRILPENEIAGFLRYEVDTLGKKYYSTAHSHFHWIPDSVKLIDKYTFARYTNDHSGCHLLTRNQLKKVIDSGGYLVEPHDEQYDLLVSAATDPYTQCGLSKVICISHLQDFVCHHLPNIYIGKLGLESNEFHRQIEALLQNKVNVSSQESLFPTETTFKHAKWSKSYYEQCRNDIISMVPNNAKNILSVGCGWGATEEALVKNRHNVAAIPLDWIIGACAKAKGIDVTYPDFNKAYESLSCKRFDCIIFSEVLQHTNDPVRILTKYVNLLTDEGVVIISVPNFSNIKFRRELASENIPSKYLRDFAKTGLHLTTKKMIKKWLKLTNMEAVRFIYGFEGRLQMFEHITPRILSHLVAARYLVVARKSCSRNQPDKYKPHQ